MNVVNVMTWLRSRIVPPSSAPLSAAAPVTWAITNSSAPPSALPSSSKSASQSAKQSAKTSPGESGYVLLLVLFMVATLILFAAAATPSILLEGRRAKDQEAIWRGNQYVRGIRLYYAKNGRYPQTLEDLAKPDAVGNHFLRKAYTDPANSGDGTWRVIYVTPSGQLVGSIHYHSLQEMAVARMPGFQLPGSPGAPAGAQSGQAGSPSPSAPGQQQTSQQQSGQPQTGQQQTDQTGQQQTGLQSGPSQPSQSAFQPTPQSTQAGQTAAPGANQVPGQSAFGPMQLTTLAPLEAVDGPVLGGFAIGVGSKVKQPSLVVYQGGKTYFDWEFIYNPLMAVAGTAQPPNGVVPGAAVPANGTATPFGAGASGSNGGGPVYPQGPVATPLGGTPAPPVMPPETSAPPPAQ